MPLAAGTRLGPYEIVAKAGAGGMGEVYRARDTRLDRTVAIKVLPEHLAADPERRKRFEHEARAVSALNHPHICTLFDIGSQDGIDFLVMEYLEGETVSARLQHGPLGREQVLRYGMQIAEALDRAHRQGFAHRDLKPGNVMLTKDGAKLLDFGLAKETAARPLDAGAATLSRALTVEGVISGTLQYMAPEQLQGQGADLRSDVFAFGAVLYEMVTGRKAFGGDSQAGVIAAILSSQPPPVTQPPSALDLLIRTCLAKDPEERWQSLHDVAVLLQRLLEESPAEAGTRPAAPRSRLPWGAAALATVAALVLAIGYWRREKGQTGAIQFQVTAPERTILGEALTISPDGQKLVFPATVADGQTPLWVRTLGSLAAYPLPGTEGASTPFWSPDGRYLAFFAQGKLRKTDVAGGQPQTLCEAGPGGGGSWNRDGVIVFSGGLNDALFRVPAAGGEARPLTTLDTSRQEVSHRHPYFLPDGRTFLYLARSSAPQNSGIYLGSLDGSPSTRVLDADLMAAYAPPGYLLFLRRGNLMAQAFDAGSRKLGGEPITVAEQVEYFLRTGMSPFTVSGNGVLAYRRGSVMHTQLVWRDRGGKVLETIGPVDEYRHLWLAPDERRLTVDRLDFQSGNRDVLMLDLTRGAAAARLSFDASVDRRALWSPDGTRIVFASDREGRQNLYQRAVDGKGGEEMFLESAETKYPTDWSRDGRWIVFEAFDRKTGGDLWVVPVGGDRKPVPFLREEISEGQGRFSPDGKWMAYASDESGKPEVYLQRFPEGGGKRQISTGGGGDPQWRRDGKELYYISSDRKLMGVEMPAGSPRALFDVRVSGLTDTRTHYFPSSDGRRFLVNTLVQAGVSSPMTVVVNWMATLKR